MAIIVEEEEKKSNILSIVGWLIFLVIGGAAVYYVFFTQPDLVIIPTTGNLSAIAPIEQASLHPEEVVQGAAFRALVSTISLPTPQSPAAVGRPNPFIAP